MVIFIKPNTLSTIVCDREIALKNGYIEISSVDYADLFETKKKWQNGVIVDDETYLARKEQELQEQLSQQHIPTTQEFVEMIEQNATDAFINKVEAEQYLTDMEIRLLILEAGK